MLSFIAWRHGIFKVYEAPLYFLETFPRLLSCIKVFCSCLTVKFLTSSICAKTFFSQETSSRPIAATSARTIILVNSERTYQKSSLMSFITTSHTISSRVVLESGNMLSKEYAAKSPYLAKINQSIGAKLAFTRCPKTSSILFDIHLQRNPMMAHQVVTIFYLC